MTSFRKFLEMGTEPQKTVNWQPSTMQYQNSTAKRSTGTDKVTFSPNDDIADYFQMTPEEQKKYLSNLSTPDLISLIWRSHNIGKPIGMRSNARI